MLLFLLVYCTVKAQAQNGPQDRRCAIMDRLKDNFLNCTSAYTILVRNSNTTNLDQLKNIRSIFPDNMLYPLDNPVVQLAGNHELVWGPGFLNVNLSTKSSSGFLRLDIHNNAKLCIPQHERDRISESFNQEVRIQKCSCVVETWQNSTPVLSGTEDCKIVHGDLIIDEHLDEAFDEETHRRLSTIVKVIGQIIISNSNFHNLSFLAGLSTIIATRHPALKIVNNSNLAELGFAKLERIHRSRESSDLNIEVLVMENNTKLSLSGQEKNMLHNAVYLESDGITIVDHLRTIDPILISGRKECKFNGSVVTRENYLSLQNCNLIRGDMILNEETDLDAEELHTSFQEVDEIDGCLTFNRTKLRDFDFFAHLKSIQCHSKTQAALSICHNSKLRRIGFSPEILSTDADRPPLLLQDNVLVSSREINMMVTLLMEYYKRGRKRNFKKMNITNFVEYDNKRKEWSIGDEDVTITWIMLSVALIVAIMVLIVVEIILYRRKKKKAKALRLQENNSPVPDAAKPAT